MLACHTSAWVLSVFSWMSLWFPQKYKLSSKSSRHSLRNSHWMLVVGGVSKLPSNHIHAVTGRVPGHIWSSLQLTPHCTRRWGVWGWEWEGCGVFQFSGCKSRDLFMFTDKFLFIHNLRIFKCGKNTHWTIGAGYITLHVSLFLHLP